MSNLKSMIHDSKKSRSELIATTVRIPKELQSFIEDFAEYLSKSKQEVILELLKEGISIAEKALEDDEDHHGDAVKFHVLNTNKKHSDSDQVGMLSQGIAAAFCEPCKHNISRILKGDVVFLYENGVGIIAYGMGSGEVKKKDHYGAKDECYYQELASFTILKSPLPAAKIKAILDRNVVFLQTMSGMPDGQKILDYIKANNLALA